MSAERYVDRKILCFDRARRAEILSYSDLMLPMGEGCEVSLADYLLDEEQKVWELRRSARTIGSVIQQLNEIYRAHLVSPMQMLATWRARTRGLNALPYAQRMEVINSYYCVPRTEHAFLLDRVMEYMMSGAEGDHSAHELSLIRFSLDYALWALRDVRRKTGTPGSFHSVESARGVAKNGRSAITIIGALFHDVLEEILDEHTDRLVARVVAEDKLFAARALKAGKVGEDLRLDIVREHLDAYNTQASGIYYAIGLYLFQHVRLFPFPDRYYQTLNSVMEVVDNLSRTKDTSYFTYIQRFVYPKERGYDPVAREDLVQAIEPHFPGAHELLDEYLEKVEGFYDTPLGTFRSSEELQRNVFREILCKILDRLNNTRDMDRHYFSVSKRLYGAGFKNLYIVQAIEEKMARNTRMPSEERRLIDVKFLNKPKVAALYQMLDEIDHIERAIGPGAVAEIEAWIATHYLGSPAFRQVRTRAQGRVRGRGHKVSPEALNVDGTVEFFTRVVLGEKGILSELDEDLPRAAAIAIVFRSLFEAFLAYPALIQREQLGAPEVKDAGNGARRGRGPEPRFEPFRIRGLNPSLEARVDVPVSRSARELDLTTFRRRIV